MDFTKWNDGHYGPIIGAPVRALLLRRSIGAGSGAVRLTN